MAKDKVVLAYSGGLDTSVILKWLQLKGRIRCGPRPAPRRGSDKRKSA